MHIRDYVEHLKSKPEHVRRRIALGSSIGVTGLVAVGWLVALGASGTLALSTPDTGASTGIADAAQETKNGFSGLLGAAAAFKASATGEAVAPITIVGGRASSTLDAQPDDLEGKTVLPF